MKQEFQMFAAYNRWANAAIYDAATQLTDQEFTLDCGLFFKSLSGTLNHLLVADRIWMRRFTGRGDTYTALDAVVHPNFAPLRIARESEDQRVIDWIDSLSERELEGRFAYTTIVEMRTISQRLAPALLHFFNHQTHHRGQASALITTFKYKSPVLDLLAFQRISSRMFR